MIRFVLWKDFRGSICLLLGKATRKLDSILKNIDIILLTNVHKKTVVKAMVFPGVMYGCESWTTKKIIVPLPYRLLQGLNEIMVIKAMKLKDTP